MSEIAGDRRKRYYVVNRGLDPDGQRLFAVVEGVPSPERPDDPGKDSRNGAVVLEASGPSAWARFNLAGFCWIDRSFKRFWEFDPDKAERIRAGDQVRRAADF